ncbi:MAG: diacylglycerol kinase family protein [Actinomycetia bacterium]|nr:diacylglycerol kinase family protein [Actinomycetes bacterium]
MRSRSLAESFRFAFAGLAYAFRTQRNMRWHTVFAALAVVLGTVLRLPAADFVLVLAAIVVVMVAEMVNTAVEAVVDIVSPGMHPLARVAKDVAAGAVLLAAAGALALGIWVFGPRLAQLPGALGLWWSRRPAGLALLGVVLVVAVGVAFGVPLGGKEEERPD